MDLVRRQYTSRSLQENPNIAKTLVERMSLPTVKKWRKIHHQEPGNCTAMIGTHTRLTVPWLKRSKLSELSKTV